MTKANQEIRSTILSSGFRFWQVADALGIAEGTFCRKLRKELPADQREHVLRTIEKMTVYREERIANE